jgi:hypothetical protein
MNDLSRSGIHRGNKLQETSSGVVAHKRNGRSRISNGSAVLDNVDGRSSTARRYRDVLNELISDMGGDPSGAQTAIARRAAALCVVCEQAEAEMVAGGVLNLAEFTTAANSLRRLLSDLGLERRAKDISPSLATYIAHRSAEAAHDSPRPITAPKQPATTDLTSGLPRVTESLSPHQKDNTNEQIQVIRTTSALEQRQG